MRLDHIDLVTVGAAVRVAIAQHPVSRDADVIAGDYHRTGRQPQNPDRLRGDALATELARHGLRIVREP